jgi:hypothetical protein
MAQTAYRDLTGDEVASYGREGVVLVKDCVDPRWIA